MSLITRVCAWFVINAFVVGVIHPGFDHGTASAMPSKVVYQQVDIETLQRPEFWPNYDEPRHSQKRPVVRPVLSLLSGAGLEAKPPQPLASLMGVAIHEGHVVFATCAAIAVLIAHAIKRRESAVERGMSREAKRPTRLRHAFSFGQVPRRRSWGWRSRSNLDHGGQWGPDPAWAV